MSTPYVKFFRGTPLAFEKLVSKNDDTLYFISVEGESTGKLYLGNKLISDNINSIAELEDIVLSELSEGHILSYDGEQEKWVNKSVLDAIGLFGGATETEQGTNGLVPAPGAGMQDAFLRGDGQWVAIEATEVSELNADEKSVSIVDEVITLKDFGIKYYRFVPETDDVAAHYEAQLVDGEHPWKEGLEPKVVLENGELVLGWFEPNSATIEGVTEQVLTLQGQVDTLTETVKEKANASDVYTKEETIDEISAAIAAADHMVRKTFDTLEKAEAFALVEGEDAVNYIFMVKRENGNGYDEYLYINGEFDLIGNWETDLTDYAKKDELNLKVDKVEGKALVSLEEIAKLETVKENAEPNFITAVDETELKVDNGLLSIISVVPSKVAGLDTLLNNKADKTAVTSLEESIGTISTKVTNLETQLNSFVSVETYNKDIAEIKDAITWKSL
jgi:hypothetical protein